MVFFQKKTTFADIFQLMLFGFVWKVIVNYKN